MHTSYSDMGESICVRCTVTWGRICKQTLYKEVGEDCEPHTLFSEPGNLQNIIC